MFAGDDLRVAIVGAGLIGCGVAYELAKRGCAVTVYDRGEPARAASWAGAGMLAPYSEASDDAAMLALCCEGLAVYPAFVDELRERVGVDAHFVRGGALHVALDAVRFAQLQALADLYRGAGAIVRLLDRVETLAREPLISRSVVGSLLIEDEAQVDNRRLGRALVAACEALSVRFERIDDLAIEADARRVRGLRTARGFVYASVVINAAGAWAGNLPGVPDTARVPVRPIAGEMVALAIPNGAMRANVWLGHGYLVPRRDGRLLIGATLEERGYDARVTARGVHAMLDMALAVAPALADFAVVETWAGLRPGSRTNVARRVRRCCRTLSQRDTPHASHGAANRGARRQRRRRKACSVRAHAEERSESASSREALAQKGSVLVRDQGCETLSSWGGTS